MRKILLALLMVNLSFHLKAQTVEPSSAINKNEFQTELQTGFLHLEDTNFTLQTWTPGTLFRLGISNLVELQLGFQLTHERYYEYKRPIVSEITFQQPVVGLAINLWKSAGFLPEAALMTRIGISYDKPISFSEMESILALNLSNELSENVMFNYNIGVTSTGTYFDSVFLISNLSFEPASKFHFFIENVLDHNRLGEISNSLSAGSGYSFSDSLIIDLSAGTNLTDPALFAGIILTWCNQL